MSVFFNIGRNPKPDFVQISCEFIAVRQLRGLISSKTGVGEGDLKVRNVISGIEYAPNEYIKRGSNVSVDITVRNLTDEPLRFHEIITQEKLTAMLDDCRFYVVKSSNEDNIQKARDCSVWATTFPNQDKFRTAFQCFKHVFILFGTNRSYELKGLARMESEPDKIPDKSIWSGVANIRLGGNFKLRWIRKKPLSLTTIEKKLGAEAKDEILKATDGYEPDPEIARKVALLFELPSEPYYKLEDLVEKKEARDLKTSKINEQLAMWALKQQTAAENPNIDQIGFGNNFPLPPVSLTAPLLAATSPKKEKLLDRDRDRDREERSQKKSKKRKSKKHRRRHSSSRSSSSSSSSSSSRSRSRSASPSRKRQRDSAMQKKHPL